MALRSDKHEHERIRVTDELLSAYIDDEVTPEERAAVEQAIARDPELALRLRALRQTVALLSALPRAPLPRAFTLSEADVASLQKKPFWRRWQGSLLTFSLRGATAVAATLFVILLVSDVWWARQAVIPAGRTAALAALEAPSAAQPAESPLAAATAIAQAPTATAAPAAAPAEGSVAIATETVHGMATTAAVPIQEAAPVAMAAEQPAQEPPAQKRAAPETSVVTEETASPVAEALAAPVEETLAPEEPVSEEEATELMEPPTATGMLEPPITGPPAPVRSGGGGAEPVPSGAFAIRGAVAPVPPGAGGGAGGGDIPGVIRGPAAQPPVPREIPPEESEVAVAMESAATPVSMPTPSPTATPSPTPTPSPAPTPTPTATPSPAPTATLTLPTPVAMAQNGASAPEGAVREQVPMAQPGPFGLSRAQTRALEVTLGALMVILGVASWLTRPC